MDNCTPVGYIYFKKGTLRNSSYLIGFGVNTVHTNQLFHIEGHYYRAYLFE
jgi:hypothetical protein